MVVQVAHHFTRAQRSDLEAAGAIVLEYVPENSFVCRYDPPDLACGSFPSWFGQVPTYVDCKPPTNPSSPDRLAR